MSLNGTEFLIIGKVLDQISKSHRPKVLCIGLPDMLFSPEMIRRYFPAIDASALALRKDGWAASANFKNDGLCWATDLFDKFGADYEVFDVKDHGNGETIADLCMPLDPSHHGRFDLVIDTGALEHFFNPGSGLVNIAQALKVGGYAYHQDALAYCGHGFYSLSPTFFVDFYMNSGFSVSHPRCWGVGPCAVSDIGMVTPLWRIDFTKEYATLPSSGPPIGVYLAQKVASADYVFPVQYRYADDAARQNSLRGFDGNLERLLAGLDGILEGDTCATGTAVRDPA